MNKKEKEKKKKKNTKIQLPHKQCISIFDIRLVNVCPDFKRFTMYVRLTRKNYDEFFGLSWWVTLVYIIHGQVWVICVVVKEVIFHVQ